MNRREVLISAAATTVIAATAPRALASAPTANAPLWISTTQKAPWRSMAAPALVPPR
jgi:hypothetical protein